MYITYLMIELRLGAQLTAKVLGWIGSWSSDRSCHLGHVDEDRFNAVAFTFHFGLEAWHFVAIEDIRNTAIHVDGCHVEAPKYRLV